MKTNILPKEIYFEEKVGSNGIHCLDYKNESDVKYVRSDFAILRANLKAIAFANWIIKNDALNWTKCIEGDENNEDSFTAEELYVDFSKQYTSYTGVDFS